MKLPTGIECRPCSATGYTVTLHSKEIGTVDRIPRLGCWCFTAPNGAYGQVKNRTEAIRNLIYFATGKY